MESLSCQEVLCHFNHVLNFTSLPIFCVYVKHITLGNCPCSSSRFFVSRIHCFGIVNWYSWLSLNMAGVGGEFSFFRGNHVRIDIRIFISIFTRPMTTKFVKVVHLEELTQMRLIKQILMTSSRQDHVTN